MTTNETLSPKQVKFLTALVSARSVEQAAAMADISKTTAYRWMREPDFTTALREARRECFQDVLRRVQGAASEAIEGLRAVMHNPGASDSARTRACEIILSTACRAFELFDLDERIARLEEAVNETTARQAFGVGGPTAAAGVGCVSSGGG